MRTCQHRCVKYTNAGAGDDSLVKAAHALCRSRAARLSGPAQVVLLLPHTKAGNEIKDN